MKEIVDSYQTLNGSILSWFPDASKAFDRVSHGVLFADLVRRGVPGYIYWKNIDGLVLQPQMCVTWGNTYSEHFSVSCGVRQGGILSPYLFNIYVNDLCVELNKEKTRCTIHGMLVNHRKYADDLVIFSPSALGLQMLLGVCETFGG